ncbi:MAG: hypothetical protein JXL84_15910, partial [Deltaproteobacteria bacterium]|nr:hypothetical protein [Deltaproteobacteria bacterium]
IIEAGVASLVQETVEKSVIQNMAGVTEKLGALEAEMTRVVEETVERVARETMPAVAEKVITEAIEALKRSLMDGPGE